MNACTLVWPRLRCRTGQTLTVYALILGLIAAAALGSLSLLGTNVFGVLNKIADSL